MLVVSREFPTDRNIFSEPVISCRLSTDTSARFESLKIDSSHLEALQIDNVISSRMLSPCFKEIPRIKFLSFMFNDWRRYFKRHFKIWSAINLEI